MRNTRNIRSIGFYVILVILFLLMVYGLRETMGSKKAMTWKEFESLLEQDQIVSVTITQNKEVPTGVLTVLKMDGSTETLNVSDVVAAQKKLADYDVKVSLEDVTRDSIFVTTFLPILLMGALILLFIGMSNRQMGGGSRMMNFGRSRAKLFSPDAGRITFADVAGLQEEKEDLRELVLFLKEPQQFLKVGARIPKGVILVGPPGTGKTLLAKAVAGEAGVPFYSISGSDFVEMFVGVGASRVRDLFEEAKQHQPCIIFIDEIDAVARRRGTGMGGGHDEREQTLNQLLVEMDGFGVNQGIIVMAATNRVDILDPAILRPGRFDRQVGVGRPDIKGREEILNVHAKNKPLGDDVDLNRTARTTAGFTGADLENLMNEAAIGAAKDHREYILQKDIDKAFIKVGIGTEKKSAVMSEKEKRITAYHESGHAILFHVLPDVGPVHTVSIIPTSMGAAGYTMPLPERDEVFRTKGQMQQNIVVALGGRVAEELVIGDVTTGAAQDIKQATAMARAMVTRFGMSDRVGLINYGDIAHTKAYGEEVQSDIDGEVKRIIDEAYAKAKEVISQNMQVLHESANLLLEKEKITREEFEALFA